MEIGLNGHRNSGDRKMDIEMDIGIVEIGLNGDRTSGHRDSTHRNST